MKMMGTFMLAFVVQEVFAYAGTTPYNPYLPLDEWLNQCPGPVPDSIYYFGGLLNCISNAVDFNTALMMVVMASVVIELVLHNIEHKIKTNFAWEFVFSIYKELMIMGLISFTFALLDSIIITRGANKESITKVFFTTITMDPSKFSNSHISIKIFELVHVMVFLRAIIYVIIIVIIYFLTRLTWGRWTRIENLERKNRGAIIRMYLSFQERMKSTSWWVKALNPKIWYNYFIIRERIDYWSVRLRFISINNLEENFPFDVYLKSRLRRLFLHLVVLDWPMWSFIFFISFCHNIVAWWLPNIWKDSAYSFKLIGEGYDYSGAGYFIFIIGLGILLLAAFTFSYTQISYWIYNWKNSLSRKTSQMNILSSFTSPLNASLIDYDFKFEDENVQQSNYHQMKDGEEIHITCINADKELSNSNINNDREVEPQKHVENVGNDDKQCEFSLDDLKCIDYRVRMNRYMIFGSSLIHYYIIQLNLVSLSFYVSLLATHYTNTIITDWTIGQSSGRSSVEGILLIIFAWLIPCIGSLLFFTFTISPFIILTSVDNMTSHQTVIFAIQRHEKHKEREKEKMSKSSVPNPLHDKHEQDSHQRNNIVDRSINYFHENNAYEDLRNLSRTIDELVERKKMIEQIIARFEATKKNEEQRRSAMGSFYYSPDNDQRELSGERTSENRREADITAELIPQPVEEVPSV